MKKLLLLIILLLPTKLYGQALPCNPNNAYWTVTTTTATLKVCASDGLSWIELASGGGGSLPTGIIILTLTSCPAGFDEATELNDKTLVGTLAANKDVGTTGGNDNITPTGTNSALTFTGTPFTDIINHTHPITDPGHTHLTQRYPTATGGSSGFTIDTSMSGTLADNTLPVKANTTGITVDNPSSGVSSITPAGTINTPTFTGNSFDNRSAFVKVIFCKKT